jgi:hypothetical protein
LHSCPSCGILKVREAEMLIDYGIQYTRLAGYKFCNHENPDCATVGEELPCLERGLLGTINRFRRALKRSRTWY